MKSLVSAEPKLSAAAQANLPTHVAVIMDGNGRWAKHVGCRGSRGTAMAWNRFGPLSVPPLKWASST